MMIIVSEPMDSKGEKYLKPSKTITKLIDTEDVVECLDYKVYDRLSKIKASQDDSAAENQIHVRLTIDLYDKIDYSNNLAVSLAFDEVMKDRDKALIPNWLTSGNEGNEKLPPNVSNAEDDINQQPQLLDNKTGITPACPFSQDRPTQDSMNVDTDDVEGGL